MQTLTDNTQFWATIGLLIVFVTDMVRRAVQRHWDKQDEAAKLRQAAIDRAAELEQARIDRNDIAETARIERNEAAEKVKMELEQTAEALKQTTEAVKEVVTVAVASEHKDELKKDIQETKDAAKQAYDVANTINHKLENMSKSGLLNQEQEAERKEIDKVEAEKGNNK